MSREVSKNSIISNSQNYFGVDAIEKNTKAVLSVYNAIKSSFGPMGLDKMCVNSAGDISITNDGAAILKNMVIDDHAAKILVDLARNQDIDVGDGTTSVVLLACNFIEKGYRLIERGVHPSVVVSGYRLSFNESVQFIKKTIAREISTEDSVLKNVINTTISSKIIKEESELFKDIIIKSMRSLNSGNGADKPEYDIKNINILEFNGGSMGDSFFKDCFALKYEMVVEPCNIKKPKILCLDIGLQKYKLPITANIVTSSSEVMEKMRKEEIEITKKAVNNILNTGANIVFISKGIDEMCLKMFRERNVMVFKRCNKNTLKKIAKYTGTSVYYDVLEEKEFITLGSADAFEIEKIGDDSIIYLHNSKKKSPSIILRGPNSQIIDEAERSLNDALNIVKRTLESGMVVPGGGAVEVSLYKLLNKYSMTVNSKEHISIFQYAEALLNIPKILATNAGYDPNDIVSKIIVEQNKLVSSKGCLVGVDIMSGDVCNTFDKGIIEPMINKLKALRTATEAAISILRINEIIILPSQPSNK